MTNLRHGRVAYEHQGAPPQSKNNRFTEMCCGTSHLRLIDSCITQVKAQGPSRTCTESKEEEEEEEELCRS